MPDIIDVFSQSPFNTVELTTQFRLITPRPTLLGTLGEDLFRTINSWTGSVAIGKSKTNEKLVHTSAIGSAPEQLEQIGSNMRMFRTRRLAKGSTLYSYQLQGVLQQPLFQAVQTAQAEMAKRAGLIRDDLELTAEYHRLGAVLGLNLDADGTTVLDNWFDAWGVPVPTPIDFDLTSDTPGLRLKCREVINRTKDAIPDKWVEGRTVVHALCGEDFFTSLITNPEVERLYLNYTAAAELANRIPDRFNFGGIVWHDYRSVQDPRFGIDGDEARFFPVGADDMFQRVLGPAEFDPYINQPGQEVVTINFSDIYRRSWHTVEMYVYPLFMCTRPEALLRGIRG